LRPALPELDYSNLIKKILIFINQIKMKMKNVDLFLKLTAIFIFFGNSANSQLYWNQACTFSGSANSYVSVPNSLSLNLTSDFTFEAWVNPELTGISSKGIIAKGGTLGTSLRYGLRLLNTGRINLFTNGVQRLTSKSSTLIQSNEWTHISASYESASNTFKIYVNGVLDTSSAVPGASPSTNTDSLYIGISGNSTPYKGQLDEVRIWNRCLSSNEISEYFRTSLGTNSGIYFGLNLSLTFQKRSNISPFSLTDQSGKDNNASGFNITAANMTFQPYNTISTNEAINLNGTNDYLSAKDSSMMFPFNKITIECWVYPRDSNMSVVIKKQSGINTAFSLAVSSTEIRTTINNNVFTRAATIPQNQWSHIAISYSLSAGLLTTFLNGNRIGTQSASAGSISNTSDSVFVGGAPGQSEFFNGYIDELRIYAIFHDDLDIIRNMYRGIDASIKNEISSILFSYKFDGNTFDNAESGGPKLFLRNRAKFSHPSANFNTPRSPLLSGQNNNYYKSYYFLPVNKKIPETGSAGIVLSSMKINMSKPINDVDVFVNLEHASSSDLRITLIRSESSDSILLFDGKITNSSDNNISLIFDDQADSTLGNNKYSSFCSGIKPLNNLNSFFSGMDSKAMWTLNVNDNVSGNTGFIYSWGIRFNKLTTPQTNLTLSSFIQGFYNPISNLTVTDTLTVELRSVVSPYALIQGSKAVLEINGICPVSFDNLDYDFLHYIVLKHRNSIETWSDNFVIFSNQFQAVQNFNLDSSFAFGDNQIRVDDSPVKYAIYSGDVNQDDAVDVSDLSLIDNDAFNFASGYIPSDVNGDDVTDLSDGLITENNAVNFVTKISP